MSTSQQNKHNINENKSMPGKSLLSPFKTINCKMHKSEMHKSGMQQTVKHNGSLTVKRIKTVK